MLDYATAGLDGCTIITDKGVQRDLTWRNAHAESVKVSTPENVKHEASSTDAAFLICTDAEPWVYLRAMNQLIASGKRITMLKLARLIQKIELANMKVTGAPKEWSDGNEYDGTSVSRETMADEGYLADSDVRHYNYTQLQGKKGRTDNIHRLQSIPPRRAAALDEGMRALRFSMMREREETINAHNERSAKFHSYMYAIRHCGKVTCLHKKQLGWL